MKRVFSLILALMLVFALSACGSSPAATTDNGTSGTPLSEPADSSAAGSISISQGGVLVVPQAAHTITNKDAYDTGVVGFQAETSGLYRFSISHPDLAAWSFYVLEDEFSDAARYLTQSYAPALEGEGTVYVAVGSWVYCYCPVNAFSGDELSEDSHVSVSITPCEGEGVYSEKLTD